MVGCVLCYVCRKGVHVRLLKFLCIAGVKLYKYLENIITNMYIAVVYIRSSNITIFLSLLLIRALDDKSHSHFNVF